MAEVLAADAARAALAALEGGSPVAVVLVVESPEGAGLMGRRLVVRETGERAGSLGDDVLDGLAAALGRRVLAEGGAALERVEHAGRTFGLYAEAQRAPEELLIVGAGHIAVPLAELGARLGYRVTVLDDREEFATAERFPTAADVRRADFPDAFGDVPIGARTHVLLVTRAHRYDFDCLRQLLEREPPPRYIGMIGSRRRVRAAFQALLEAGMPRERLGRVSSPVGLDIGAETPMEIAVSIAAELIALRRGGDDPRPLSLKERVLDRLLPEG